MAHKTFISYKYSEARNLRDRIIDALGEDATFYKGETSDTPDLTDLTTESIKERLKDMIYGASVTIVVISPNMAKSKWIDWEIEYSLKAISRNGKTSHTNGVVGVLMKINGSYDWIRNTHTNADECVSSSYDGSVLYSIIRKNRFNQNPKAYSCKQCKTVNEFEGSYISFVDEDDFLDDPNRYIDYAFKKSQNTSGYDLCKQR